MDDEVVESAAQRLYGLPLADFTKERNELATGLRKEGRRAEADAVKELPKPTVAAWALNQLARHRASEVEELVKAGEQLRRAQEDLLAGGGRALLEEATRQEQRLLGELASDAAALAGEGGASTTATLVDRLRSTLHAAALDEEVAGELGQGRLLREREAVGLFGLAEGAPAPRKASRQPPAEKRQAADQKRQTEVHRRLQRARTEGRATRRRLETAVRAADRERVRSEDALERLRRAEEEQQRLTKASEAAAAEVSRLEGELEGLRRSP